MQYEREEFFKLDHLDRRIAFWLMDNAPGDIQAWVKYMEREYARKRLSLNSNKLCEEIMAEVKK